MKVGLNVGSGQRPFTSTSDVKWMNVDSQEKWNPDIVCNATRLPFEPESCDYVVLHHVLEHFGCGEGIELIREGHRVLKRDGSLLVFVPNLRALALKWLDDGISTQIYVTNLYGAYMGDEADRHKWGFDNHSLWTLLRDSSRWMTVRAFDWRAIPGANIAQDFWILGMECVK